MKKWILFKSYNINLSQYIIIYMDFYCIALYLQHQSTSHQIGHLVIVISLLCCARGQ